MKFGRNPFALRFGGGPNVLEIEHMAMLDALAPGWDVSEDTAVYAEAYAHALAVTAIWRVNGRLKNSRVPSKMLETLPIWEAACGLRPLADDTAPARRRRLAARLRGFAGNSLTALYDLCSTLAGPNFVGLALPTPDSVTTYWPGLNAGPPGYEWTSARVEIAVRISPVGLSDADLSLLIQNLRDELQIVLPAWMDFSIGVFEEGFVADVGTVDLTFI